MVKKKNKDGLYERIEEMVYLVMTIPIDVLCGMLAGSTGEKREEEVNMIAAISKGIIRAGEKWNKEERG
jgi:hypothetical protein